MARPRPERFYEAGRVLVAVTGGHLRDGAGSARSGAMAVGRSTPAVVACVGRSVISGAGGFVRGSGLRLRRMAGRFERIVER